MWVEWWCLPPSQTQLPSLVTVTIPCRFLTPTTSTCLHQYCYLISCREIRRNEEGFNFENLPISDEDKIDVLSRRSVCIWNSKPYICFSSVNLLESAILEPFKSGIEKNRGKKERERAWPVSNGEESSGVWCFYVGEVVVGEEKANEFVDRQSAYYLHPHPSFLFRFDFGKN